MRRDGWMDVVRTEVELKKVEDCIEVNRRDQTMRMCVSVGEMRLRGLKRSC